MPKESPTDHTGNTLVPAPERQEASPIIGYLAEPEIGFLGGVTPAPALNVVLPAPFVEVTEPVKPTSLRGYVFAGGALLALSGATFAAAYSLSIPEKTVIDRAPIAQGLSTPKSVEPLAINCSKSDIPAVCEAVKTSSAGVLSYICKDDEIVPESGNFYPKPGDTQVFDWEKKGEQVKGFEPFEPNPTKEERCEGADPLTGRVIHQLMPLNNSSQK